MGGPREFWMFRLGLGFGDAAVLCLATVLTNELRFGVVGTSINDPRWLVALVMVPAFLVLFWSRRLYDEEYLLVGVREYSQAVTACTYGTLGIVALSFFVGGSPIVSRSWLVFYWALSAVSICVWRFLARRLVRRLRARGRLVSKLIIAGASDQGVAIAEQLDAPILHGSEVVGFVDDYLPIGTVVTNTRRLEDDTLRNCRVLGAPEELPRFVKEHGVRDVIVVPQALSWESLEMIIREGVLGDAHYRVRLAPGLYDVMATGVRAIPRGHVPLLAMDKARLTGMDRCLKSLADYSLSAAMLITAAPLIGGLVLAAKLVGRRPIFERRSVLGLSGRRHTLWLFGPWLSGHVILRGLPALASVVRGHLSLVGPRPHAVVTDGVPARLHGLLVMKPGLTGLWRLASGGRGAPSGYHDLWYVRNYTIWEDMRILFRSLLCLCLTARARNSAHKLRRWEAGPPADAPVLDRDLTPERVQVGTR